MGNIVNTFKRLSGNNTDDISLRRCSYLSNVTPTLDKCAVGDNDSSVTRRAASTINNSVNGCETFYKEVEEEIHLTIGSTSRSGHIGNIDCSTVPLANTEPSGGHEAKKKRKTKNDIIHKDAGGQDDASDSDGLVCNCTADQLSRNFKDERIKNSKSLTAVSCKDFFSKVPEENCCTDPEVAEDFENVLAMDKHKSKKLRPHRFSHANGLFDRDAYEKWIDCGKSTPEAPVNHKMVPNEDITEAMCSPLDVKDCGSTPKALSKRQTKRKRTNCKVSNQMMVLVPNERISALVPFDVQYPGTVGLPITRSKAKAFSVSTPEYLGAKSTRSGRLIVPPLDPGSQNIIYDRDGSIRGITCTVLQRREGINSEPPVERKKRTRCSTPSNGRLLLFDSEPPVKRKKRSRCSTPNNGRLLQF